MNNESGASYSVAIAAEIAFLLVQAHPFWDGNGRISGGVATWVLLQAGYEPWFDLRLYCRERAEVYFRAFASRDDPGPTLLDASPWRVFFKDMVAYCFGPPTRG
jgi:hypothetical protein